MKLTMASIMRPMAEMIPAIFATTTATIAPEAAAIVSKTGISFSTIFCTVCHSLSRDALIGANQDCMV